MIYSLITALASPVPPLFETPGIKQIQKQADMFPDPTAKLPFEKNLCDSPAVPTFQTPGLSISKQAAKIAPQQALADKKKAVVGLFQEEAGAGIRWGPQEMQAPSINQTFVKEEPQPPDLTYSLEVCTVMIQSFLTDWSDPGRGSDRVHRSCRLCQWTRALWRRNYSHLISLIALRCTVMIRSFQTDRSDQGGGGSDRVHQRCRLCQWTRPLWWKNHSRLTSLIAFRIIT